MEKESVDINGEKIIFFVQRKNIKNINLKVNLDKKVTMSIPMKMEIEIAKEFVKKKAEWIKKQQNYYETFAEEKENITFENGETVYLLGKQYKMKIIPSNKNSIEVKGKYFEINIKEKYVANKNYIRKVYDKWLKEYAEQNQGKSVQEMIDLWNGISERNDCLVDSWAPSPNDKQPFANKRRSEIKWGDKSVWVTRGWTEEIFQTFIRNAKEQLGVIIEKVE